MSQALHMSMEPYSSTEEFFQVPPVVDNQYHEDAALRRVLTLHLPSTIHCQIEPDLSSFGRQVLTPEILNYVADAEKNPPFLRTWDTWGKRVDELVTSEGWRKLQDMGIAAGMVAIPYENKQGEYSRFYQFAKYHLWTGSCAYVTCPSAMGDGAARLLWTHLLSDSLDASTRTVLESAFDRLTSRDPARAWTSGQWMTERAGGSDVSATETTAIHTPLNPATAAGQPQTGVDGASLGPWSISGFKWFSSATDSHMTVLLARTPSGVSAFYAPLRRTTPSSPATPSTTEPNGVSIQRLKRKLGTRALPTAELELSHMRGHLLGVEGRGVREIATVLNITRLHNAVTAMGLWGRGLAISRACARMRKMAAGGKAPVEVRAHVRVLAAQSVAYRANMHVVFFAVRLLGIAEQAASSPHCASRLVPSARAHISLLLRVLTPVVKALTAKAAIAALQECVEALGEAGYLEGEEQRGNVARLLRDANVLSIWEGTTDVMAEDVVRVVTGRRGAEVMGALAEWVGMGGESERGMGGEMGSVRERWARWRRGVEGTGGEELKARGREFMGELGWIACAVLLCVDAGRDCEAVAAEVARRWVRGDGNREMGWREREQWDRRIVFGDEKDWSAKL
ncbi:hypothetical protein MMC08_008505 [Hypocenomyce scalaris]|nr:hypothetical protein [Hypocenomyce scalaris]